MPVHGAGPLRAALLPGRRHPERASDPEPPFRPCLVDTWKADPRRIYATGISNGADMSFKLAVELPGTPAAIAPVSGGCIGTAAENPAYVPKTLAWAASRVDPKRSRASGARHDPQDTA
ncbi:hypothetical protein [Streptomyces sp. RerS4]|uniref:hypothetical protein n=1 Tax=Streptomyces sp. RerS4 TaxID=2942449 RepID=UPI00201C67EC|nr:hypothetical protein [Streptomyces sp. RerS4]UQX00790.1 hypothetical protein M4D82_09835 [Streptomyces sp. RerS4]